MKNLYPHTGSCAELRVLGTVVEIISLVLLARGTRAVLFHDDGQFIYISIDSSSNKTAGTE